jgi:hypothetical protein
MTYTQMNEVIERIIDEMLLSQERSLLREYRAIRDGVKKEVGDFYLKFLTGVPGEDHKIVAQQYNRMKKLDKTIQGTYVAFGSKEYSMIEAGQEALFEEVYNRKQYVYSIFTDVKYNRLNPLVTEWSVTNDIEIWKRIRTEAVKEAAKPLTSNTGVTLKALLSNNKVTELKKIQQVIKSGFMTGKSFTNQAKALDKTFNSFASNALRVVRTEGNRNANAAAYYQAESSGIKAMRRWVATLDDRTRETHQRLDGQEVELGEYFHVNGDRALFPGDFSDVAENVNCRCSVIDILPGVDPSLRRARDPFTGETFIASFSGYDDWKQEHGI